MLHVTCEQCGNAMRLPDQARGKSYKCPVCEHVGHVPADAPSEPARPEPGPPAAAPPAAPSPAARRRRKKKGVSPALMIVGGIVLLIALVMIPVIIWGIATLDDRKEGAIETAAEQMERERLIRRAQRMEAAGIDPNAPPTAATPAEPAVTVPPPPAVPPPVTPPTPTLDATPSEPAPPPGDATAPEATTPPGEEPLRPDAADDILDTFGGPR